MSVFALFDNKTFEKINFEFLQPSRIGERIDIIYLDNVSENTRDSLDKGIKEMYVLASKYSKKVPERIAILFRGFEKKVLGNSTDLSFATAFFEYLINEKILTSQIHYENIYVTGVIGNNGDIKKISGLKSKLESIKNSSESIKNSIFIYPFENKEELESIMKSYKDISDSENIKNITLCPLKNTNDIFSVFKITNSLCKTSKFPNKKIYKFSILFVSFCILFYFIYHNNVELFLSINTSDNINNSKKNTSNNISSSKNNENIIKVPSLTQNINSSDSKSSSITSLNSSKVPLKSNSSTTSITNNPNVTNVPTSSSLAIEQPKNSNTNKQEVTTIPKSNILINSDFNDGNLDFWNIDKGTSWNILNGKYTCSSSEVSISTYKKILKGNFTLEVDVSLGKDEDAGVIFKSIQPSNEVGYYFGLYPKENKGVLFKLYDGLNIAEQKVSLSSSNLNHIKITSVDSNIKIFVNNTSTPIIDVQDSDYMMGFFGLRSHYCEAAFDNFIVKSN